MQVSERVHMLKVSGEFGTIYPVLISQGQEMVLVDTGFPMQMAAIQQAITDAGFSADKLTHILLTHQDMDHIGCAKELVALSGARLCAHEQEAPYVQGDTMPVKIAGLMANLDALDDATKAWAFKMQSGFERCKAPVDHWLKDGEVLPLCGGIEVIHTPGHTPGHACFFVQQDGVMIAGDTLNVHEGKLVGPNPQHTADMGQAIASNAKLGLRDAQHTITYHCGLFEGDLRTALQRML